MKRLVKSTRCALLPILLAGSYALADHGDASDQNGTVIVYAVADQDVIEILSGVDFVPPKNSLDGVLGETALEDLINIAQDPDEDAGLRIRAYRALAHYPGALTEEALRTAIIAHSSDGQVALESTGVDTILLRAAMSSMASVAKSRAVNHIGWILDHQSRDVRAAAAQALALTGSITAEPLLRARLGKEEVPQVRLAIEEAIRILHGDEIASP